MCLNTDSKEICFTVFTGIKMAYNSPSLPITFLQDGHSVSHQGIFLDNHRFFSETATLQSLQPALSAALDESHPAPLFLNFSQ